MPHKTKKRKRRDALSAAEVAEAIRNAALAQVNRHVRSGRFREAALVAADAGTTLRNLERFEQPR